MFYVIFKHIKVLSWSWFHEVQRYLVRFSIFDAENNFQRIGNDTSVMSYFDCPLNIYQQLSRLFKDFLCVCWSCFRFWECFNENSALLLRCHRQAFWVLLNDLKHENQIHKKNINVPERIWDRFQVFLMKINKKRIGKDQDFKADWS